MKRTGAIQLTRRAAMGWAALLTLLLASLLPLAQSSRAEPAPPVVAAVDGAVRQVTSGMVHVIVQEVPDAGPAARRLIARTGGAVTRELPLIGGYAAAVPAKVVDGLSRLPGVATISLDRHVTVQGGGGTGSRSPSSTPASPTSATWPAGSSP
jgi:hypothetical protein